MFSSLLGPTEKDIVNAETERIPFAMSIVKQLALGGGLATGGGVVWGAFELLRDNPHDAFPLLRSWGPWAFVTMFVIWVLYDIAKMVLSMAQRGVIALEGLASAQQTNADKDDRQIQELETLTSFTSQQSLRTSDSMTEAHTKIDSLAGQVGELKALLIASAKEKGQ